MGVVLILLAGVAVFLVVRMIDRSKQIAAIDATLAAIPEPRRTLFQRADIYLQAHPEDEAAVQMILFALDLNPRLKVRDVAGMLAGREITEQEWAVKDWARRWDRAWGAIVY